ncbi:MAG: SBBP repeat-containing protein [Candidatus Thorarchaeota archaeon]
MTYFGGSNSDEVRSMIIDENGDIVIAGQTTSNDFVTVNAAQGSRGNGNDLFITKINGSSHTVIFSTYCGGSGQEYLGSDIAIDSEGNIIVGGATASRDLPLLNPYQDSYGGGELDAVIVKYSPNGTLLFCTYFGGSALDWAYGISVDSDDNIVFTGHMTSPDYPVVNAIQEEIGGLNDAVVTKLSPDGQTILFSTFIGGPDEDLGLTLEIDSDGWIILAGLARSGYPVYNAVQGECAGTFDTIVTKLSSDGQTLNFSTYYGGSGEDGAWGLAIDGNHNIIVGGRAWSDDVPTLNAFQEGEDDDQDGFVLKLDPRGTPLFASYLGGSTEDMVWDVDTDSQDSIYLTGYTGSNDFFTLNPVKQNRSGSYDAFLTKIDNNNSVVFSTYTGGSGSDYSYSVDATEELDVYIAGRTTSGDLDLVDAIQAEYGGSLDSMIGRFNPLHDNSGITLEVTTGIIAGIALIAIVLFVIVRKRGG